MSRELEDRILDALKHVADRLNSAAWQISKIIVKGAFPIVDIAIETEPVRDRRLSRLDDARTAMEDGLAALDQLKAEALAKQQQHELTLLQLQRTLESQETAQQKLDAIQDAMKADVQAFRTLHGVGDPKTERVIGFWTGVAASVVATGFTAFVAWVWVRWGAALWAYMFP